MILTVRFAHMAEAPALKVGDKIARGQRIGTVGSSGQSTAPHLHIDLAGGEQIAKFHLESYEHNNPPPGPLRELLYFIDPELFGGVAPVVTTPYAEVEYFHARGKVHYGFDLVPKNRHDPKADMGIYWNRSAVGTVLAVLDDPSAYGHCLYVGYEV